MVDRSEKLLGLQKYKKHIAMFVLGGVRSGRAWALGVFGDSWIC